MEESYYFFKDNNSVGPFSREQILTLFRAQSLELQTLIWRQGDRDWIEFATVFPEEVQPPPLPRASFQPVKKESVTALPLTPRLPKRIDGPLSNSTVPHRFINSLNSTEARSPSGHASASWHDTKPHPWRRYFARMLDNTIGGILCWAIVSALMAVLFPRAFNEFLGFLDGPLGSLFSIVSTHAFAVLPNALMVGTTGGNLGKWLMGTKVTDANGRPIGFKKALWREGQIFTSGLGFGIPIIALFTMIGSYSYLKNNSQTKYDERQKNIITARTVNAPQVIGSVIAIALLAALYAALALLNS